MAHLTAGDILPIYTATEITYGSAPPTSLAYYGDVAEGGAIRFTDTPNPHLAWRYGSRTFSADDYVTTQTDAGFTAGLEVRDLDGWEQIITNAYTGFGTALPSRVAYICTSTAAYHVYFGCKTDSLTVSADAPGGVVTFDETVLAAYYNTSSTPATSSAGDAPAVQWLGGVTLGGATIYPQRFSLSIANNLERIRGPALSSSAVGETGTRALVEGRCDISLEMDVWLDDFTYIEEATSNSAPTSAVLTIGSDYPATLTLADLCHVGDGQHPDLKQDKMTQTLRYRVGSLTVA